MFQALCHSVRMQRSHFSLRPGMSLTRCAIRFPNNLMLCWRKMVVALEFKITAELIWWTIIDGIPNYVSHWCYHKLNTAEYKWRSPLEKTPTPINKFRATYSVNILKIPSWPWLVSLTRWSRQACLPVNPPFIIALEAPVNNLKP